MGDLFSWVKNAGPKIGGGVQDSIDWVLPGEMDGVDYRDGKAYWDGSNKDRGWWQHVSPDSLYDDFYKDVETYRAPERRTEAAPTVPGQGAPGFFGGLFNGFLDKVGGGLNALIDGVTEDPQEAAARLDAQQRLALLGRGPFSQLGAAPQPHIRSMAELMQDPALMDVANQQIIAANAAIGRDNRDKRTQMMRDVQSINRAGAHAQQQIQQVGADHARAQAAIERRHDTEQQGAQRSVDDVIRNVAMNVISDDNVRSELQADQAVDRRERVQRQSADDRMMADAAVSGQDVLSEYAAAQPMATRADAQAARASALEDIMTNRSKAADNWLGRSAILAELAKGEREADQLRAAAELEAYSTKAGVLDSWRTAALTRQQLGAATEGAEQQKMLDGLSAYNGFVDGMYDSMSTMKKVDEEGNEFTTNVPRVNYMDPAMLEHFNSYWVPYLQQQGIPAFSLQQVAAPR